MAKTCLMDECNNPVWGGGYCKFHQNFRTDKKPKRPSPKSNKMIEALKEYKVVRAGYLERHPVCQVKLPGCTKEANQIHHKAGRIGALLTDIRYFVAICHYCHHYIETHPVEAKENGWSVSRFIK